MFQQLGIKIRTIREQKGYSLNQFAKKIGVSSAYLSNLETGKSDTIKLEVLENLSDELQLFTKCSTEDDLDIFSIRTNRVLTELTILNRTNPKLALFLLETVEQGVKLFIPPSESYTDNYDSYTLQ
jgi:transcriptional regulator with XRE-family HTH domain